MLLGGLTAADTSRTDIRIVDARGDQLVGSLPFGLHDTAVVRLGSAVYLFGGGTNAGTQSDAILRIPVGGGAVSTVGRLPAPSSDQSVAVSGDTGYVVGGYTGSRWLNTIVAWKPGSSARVVAHLPFTLRYAAVTAVGKTLVIAGGSLENGTASSAVLAYTPGRGSPADRHHGVAIAADGSGRQRSCGQFDDECRRSRERMVLPADGAPRLADEAEER